MNKFRSIPNELYILVLFDSWGLQGVGLCGRRNIQQLWQLFQENQRAYVELCDSQFVYIVSSFWYFTSIFSRVNIEINIGFDFQI